MSDVPELTDREAAVLRFAALYRDAGPDRTESYCEDLASQGLVKPQGGITDRGRETLDAFDARIRSLTRVAAMRECQFVAEAMAVDFDDGTSGLAAGRAIAKAISEKIAKEETRT